MRKTQKMTTKIAIKTAKEYKKGYTINYITKDISNIDWDYSCFTIFAGTPATTA